MGDGAVHTNKSALVPILRGTVDPTAGSGVAAPVGWLYFNSSSGSLWHKTGSGDTIWTRVLDLSDIHSALFYKGVIDCSGNPNYPAANSGDVYIVSVAGKIGGASGINVEVQDMLICRVDSSPSGDQAAVGANWNIIQANVDGAVTGPASATSGHITSFNGATGKIIQDSGYAAQDASISVKGFTQLSNSYSGVSEALAVTEKALADGLGTRQAASAELTGIASLITNGMVSRIGTGSYTARTITGTANRLSVTDGDGVGGNPTLNIDTSLLPSPGSGDVGKALVVTAANAASWSTVASATDSNAIHKNVASEIYALTYKSTLSGDDVVVIEDSADSYAKKSTKIERILLTALTDVTTNNVSTSAHGYCPKAPNDMTQLLDGTGVWSVRRMIENITPIANNASDANNDIEFYASWQYDSTGAVEMALTFKVKRLDALWAAGSSQGGLGSGTKAANTWYHCFVIKHTNGTVDAGFDTSLTAANLLSRSGYSYYRYVGSILTNASSNIIAFYQVGDMFLWKSPVIDWSGKIGTATTITLNVPYGISCHAYLNVYSDTVNDYIAYFSSPNVTDMAPSTSAAPLFTIGTSEVYINRQVQIITNTLSQIRGRTNYTSGLVFDITCLGYRNLRLSL